jgi:hypothetical protein
MNTPKPVPDTMGQIAAITRTLNLYETLILSSETDPKLARSYIDLIDKAHTVLLGHGSETSPPPSAPQTTPSPPLEEQVAAVDT